MAPITLIVGTPDFHNPRVKGRSSRVATVTHYVITGQKAAWVSNGTLATHAALYLHDRTAVHGMAGGGIAFVPLNLPGVSKGKPLNKLGQRALNQGEIFFDGRAHPSPLHADRRPMATSNWRRRRLTLPTRRCPSRSPGSRAPHTRKRWTIRRDRVQGGKADL